MAPTRQEGCRILSSLYEEFERLHQRYHLEQFLKAKGLDYERMTEEQLEDELRQAIAELKGDPE